MNIGGEEILIILTGAVAFVGVLTSFLKDRKLKALTNVVLAFGEEAACYLRIRADGTLDTEELNYLGLVTVNFFEKVEDVGIV